MIEKGSVFENFDDFFNWYVAVIGSIVPNYKQMQHKSILDAIPRLTPSEVLEMNKIIVEYQELPKGIILICDDSAHTFYSTFSGGVYKIAYPSIFRYWLRYPPIMKAAIQHEFGHIMYKDCLLQSNESHGDCNNICMDIRINQNINNLELQQMYRCLFTFKNEFYKGEYTPESMFPKIGIQLALKGKVGFDFIHKKYHEFYNTDSLRLKVGEYIVLVKEITNPTNNKVFKVGTFGIITKVNDDQTYSAEKLVDELQDIWKSDDYIFMRNYYQSKGIHDYTSGASVIAENKLSDIADGLIADTLVFKKDFFQAIPPKEEQSFPQIGDFIITIKDINSDGDIIPSLTYGQVIGFAESGSYASMGDESDEEDEEEGKATLAPNIIVNPLTSEFQEIFKKRDFALFALKILTEKLCESTSFQATFPINAVVIRPPNEKQKPTDEPQNADEKKPPKVGDVVITKNKSYGIVEKINNNFTFVINEISKEQAMIILKSRV